MIESLRSARLLLSIAFRADPWRAFGAMVLWGGMRAAVGFLGLFLKLLVDGVVAGDDGQVQTAAIAMGVATVFTMAGAWTGFVLQTSLEERTGHRIDRHLIELMAGVPGLEHHERPAYLDRLELLRTQRSMLSGGVSAVIMLVASLVQIVVTAALLASVHPLLLLLPVFSIPSLAATAAATNVDQRAMEAAAKHQRRARHFLETITTVATGKEVRLAGAGEELRRRHHDDMRAAEAVTDRARLKSIAIASGGWFVFAIGMAIAMLFVGREAIAGRTSPGTLLLAVTLAASMNENVMAVAGSFNWFFHAMKAVGRYRWLIDYGKDASEVAGSPAGAPDRLDVGILFEGVGFRYPDTEADVLVDVDLELPAGSIVALVGDNGAGKSTLVKLLARFYEPTAGRVLVDGVDLGSIPPSEWRARTSAGFQDFARLELLARHSVGSGDLPAMDDDDVVGRALVRSGAADVVDVLPDGLGTQLGKTYADGVELSGGQWQKIALGRAMMREAPLLLLLDEPTAALDPNAEHALFERYSDAARRLGRQTGSITVLVSHRFSTVRMADLIVVVEDGRVTQAGSHAELMAAGGTYATLYDLQAGAYR